MALRAPERPRRLLAAGFIGWVVLTIIASVVDQDNFGARLAKSICQAVGSVFFALAVGGGILAYWQRGEWLKRTQWIPFGLLNQAMRQLANLVSHAVDVAMARAGDRHSATQAAFVFSLPWSPLRDKVLAIECDNLVSTAMILASDDFAEGKEHRAGVDAMESVGAPMAEMEGRVDKLWTLGVELGSYVDDHLGPRLLTNVGNLHDAVRHMIDPWPGRKVQIGLSASYRALTATDVVAQTFGNV